MFSFKSEEWYFFAKIPGYLCDQENWLFTSYHFILINPCSVVYEVSTTH